MKDKKLLLYFLEEEDQSKEEIQIIPTIDVMMFLLVFFILYTINVIPMFQQSITLPSTKTAEEQKLEKVLRVYIDREGNISTEEGLKGEQSLRNYIREHRQDIKAVLIVADKDLKMEKVLKLLDLLKEEGITNLGIASHKERT